MGKILNQYSFLVVALLLVGLAVYALSRRGFRWPDWLLLAVLIGLLVGAWWVLHPTTSGSASVDSVREQIGGGTPVLLEFQSPY